MVNALRCWETTDPHASKRQWLPRLNVEAANTLSKSKCRSTLANAAMGSMAAPKSARQDFLTRPPPPHSLDHRPQYSSRLDGAATLSPRGEVPQRRFVRRLPDSIHGHRLPDHLPFPGSPTGGSALGVEGLESRQKAMMKAGAEVLRDCARPEAADQWIVDRTPVGSPRKRGNRTPRGMIAEPTSPSRLPPLRQVPELEQSWPPVTSASSALPTPRRPREQSDKDCLATAAGDEEDAAGAPKTSRAQVLSILRDCAAPNLTRVSPGPSLLWSNARGWMVPGDLASNPAAQAALLTATQPTSDGGKAATASAQPSQPAASDSELLSAAGSQHTSGKPAASAFPDAKDQSTAVRRWVAEKTSETTAPEAPAGFAGVAVQQQQRQIGFHSDPQEGLDASANNVAASAILIGAPGTAEMQDFYDVRPFSGSSGISIAVHKVSDFMTDISNFLEIGAKRPVSQGSARPFSQGSARPFSQGSRRPFSQGSQVGMSSLRPPSELSEIELSGSLLRFAVTHTALDYVEEMSPASPGPEGEAALQAVKLIAAMHEGGVGVSYSVADGSEAEQAELVSADKAARLLAELARQLGVSERIAWSRMASPSPEMGPSGAASLASVALLPETTAAEASRAILQRALSGARTWTPLGF
eukprot:TRINITY_DN16305_c0_g1_i2.p1 TRINITY_DN16305_c0_g1~~TRINITY_DN16305_c0_g1_i2.p1  ORF type:complete len:643 (+),score=115.99 TRINITY_DN16305_c0_g1_i2:118-2046(+)